MNLKKKNNDIVLEEVWCENGAGSTLPLVKYPLLEQTGIVEHCFTTRIGGVSKGIYESLNLSFTRGDEDAAVRENFRRLAGAMKTDVSKFVFTDQTHTTNVRRLTAEVSAGKITSAKQRLARTIRLGIFLLAALPLLERALSLLEELMRG